MWFDDHEQRRTLAIVAIGPNASRFAARLCQVVARLYGVRTREIVMFPIGGVSRLDRQPNARQEPLIALAGPGVTGTSGTASMAAGAGGAGAASGQQARPGYTPTGAKIGRNDACWCGSGRKYKKCHGS